MSEVNLKPFSVITTAVEKYEPTWIRFPWLSCGTKYRKIRRECCGQKEFKCGKCNKEFAMGEPMGLVGMKHHVNMCVCHSCINEIQEVGNK